MTPRESACLKAIAKLTVDGVPPSMDELCRYLRLASKSGVTRMLRSLEAQGLITRRPGKARSLALTAKADPYSREALDQLSHDSLVALHDLTGSVLIQRARRAA